MNILAIYNSFDVAGYYMLGELSKRDDITVYIAIAYDDSRTRIQGNCIPLMIPPVKSKFSPKAIKALRKIISQYDIDIAYAISTSALSNVIFAACGNKKIKIVGYSGSDTKISWLDPTHFLGWMNPRADMIVCVQPHVKELLQRRVKEEKLAVIEKPYDMAWARDAYDNPKQVAGIPDDAFKVICIAGAKGRPSKGQRFLVEAATILNDPSVHFIFLGSYSNNVRTLAQKSPVRDNIHLLGPTKNAKQYLRKQDLYVLPSLYDAWPRVVREAMACELPCVVTDIPGARNMVVDGQTGILVKPGSGQALADGIRWMKEHEAERKEFGRRGRERIIAVYPSESYAAEYEKLFRRLTGS